MKRGAIVIMLWLTGTAFSQPSVTILEPQPGYILPSGKLDTIRWSATSENPLESAYVYFSRDNGANWTSLGIVPATQNFLEWAVPHLTSIGCLLKVEVSDTAGNLGADVLDSTFNVYVPGDADRSSTVTLADPIFIFWPITNYPIVPIPLLDYTADVNCSGAVTLGDIIYLVNHIFNKPGFETLCGRSKQ